MRLLFVFGTRPEAIKLAPVILQAQRQPALETSICSTGQHREMLDQVLRLFGLRPDVDLQVMQAGQSLPALTASILTSCHDVLDKLRPDVVVVHGDTTSTLGAALAAYYARIPVAHVEAGLRTGDIYSPWPEELNRRLTAGIASCHFAPTARARDNLLREGIAADTVHVTGNTVIDALQMASRRIGDSPELARSLDARLPAVDPQRRLLLVTGHRRENFGPGFDGICDALVRLHERDDVQIVYPVHPNPRVRSTVTERLAGKPGIHLIEPLDYLPFIRLLSRCHIVLTDSGGIQEEAPALGKPVLVMRDTTERPEAIEAGTARLVGTNPGTIASETCRLLDDADAYRRMAQAHNPFGDGHAGERIVDLLRRGCARA